MGSFLENHVVWSILPLLNWGLLREIVSIFYIYPIKIRVIVIINAILLLNYTLIAYLGFVNESRDP